MGFMSTLVLDYRPFVMGKHLPSEGLARKTFSLSCQKFSGAECRHFGTARKPGLNARGRIPGFWIPNFPTFLRSLRTLRSKALGGKGTSQKTRRKSISLGLG